MSYSKGSCGELRSQIYIAVKIGEIEAEQADKWLAEAKEISCMLTGLMKSIESW
ncbi:four helix bundle protein [Pseudoalteromonas sp. SCSIO 43101]|nr:four helix bundle protein [Pseudoalteromonas sp. SCSIO 43101]